METLLARPTVDLTSQESRTKLAGMVTRLFDHWQLKKTEQMALLGLSPSGRTTLRRYSQGCPLANNRDLLDRVSHLLGIHKSLRILYPQNPTLAYGWPKAPNKRLNNLTPVQFIDEEGFAGLSAVRRMLDLERGR